MGNILQVMKQTTILPSVQKLLTDLGENIKLSRLRRKMSAEQVSERANLSRRTYYSIEQGSAGVAMGNYAMVLFVLGLEKDLLKIAEDDKLGRKLQDSELIVKERAPKR